MSEIDFNSVPFSTALTATQPSLDAIPPGELETINLDVPACVVTVLGVEPKLAELREAARAKFGDAQAAFFEKLATAARAAGKAHVDHEVLLSGADLEPISKEVVALRAVLLVDAQSLVHQKRMEAGLLGELQGIQGLKNQCFDLLQLVSAFRKSWPKVEAFTPVKLEDLDRAERLANELATAAGIRDQAAAGSSPSADVRRRAFTHLVRTYDQVRRAVTYLRWKEGDADSIVPSLWAGRRSRRSDIGAAPTTTTPTTTTTTPNNIAPGRPGAPALGPA